MIASLIPGLKIGTEAAVISIISLFSMVAAAGGVGGGPINVSIFLFFGIDPSIAVPLSTACICGGTISLLMFNLFQSLPGHSRQPIIQWDLVFVLEPASIIGALLGSLVNKVLPSWVTLLLETLFIGYIAIRMIRQGINIINKERVARGLDKVCLWCERKPKKRTKIVVTEPVAVLSTANLLDHKDQTDDVHDTAATESSAATRVKEEPPSRKCKCVQHMATISRMRITNFMLTVVCVIGCELGQNYLGRCTPGYWGLFACILALGSLSVIFNTLLMKRSVRSFEKERVEEDAHSVGALDALLAKHRITIGTEPARFTTIKNYARFAGTGLAAGLICAIMGVGGGLLKNPVMMAFGIDPMVSRAASSTMIAFTSLSAVISYILLGTLDFSYTWPLMVIVAVFFVSGYFLSNLMMRSCKTRSIVPFSMAFMLVFATCFIGYKLVSMLVQIGEVGVVPGFRPFCGE